MKKPLEFWSKDNRFGLRVFAAEIDLLIKLCAKCNTKETGGILIGKYSTSLDCAIVTEVTHPTADSEGGNFWFIRGVKGLKKKLFNIWKSKREFYLGEWHFHPNGSPEPSETDFSSLKGISKSPKYKCPEPILLILGGTPTKNWKIRVFIYNQVTGFIELHTLS